MARSAAIGAVVPARAWLRALSVSGVHRAEGGDRVLISLPACARRLTAPLPAGYQARALKQLTHELDVIERTNLAEFFLIVWDLMEFARTGGIIGQGRGSAGDSIVAYCLGITKVDPIEHKLLFERFINEARALPDIDIDFDVNRREEVIQYLYTRYGADHAAMVCTIVTYRARNAVREVAKALGFPPEGIDALAKALDTRDATDVARDLALDGSFAWLFDELGIDMADAAVPPGRDGRAGTAARAVRASCIKSSDSSWNHRPRPSSIRSAPGQRGRLVAAAQGRACSTHRSRRCDTRRPRRSATRDPGSWRGRSSRCPTPRDNGSPGPSSGRPVGGADRSGVGNARRGAAAATGGAGG